MIPIQSNTNQDGCPPISSNCVIWQGPDIPCINLCKGDSISDIVAKLAQELCDLVDQLNISTFDLTCFNPICPNPSNIHDLIQFLIDKVCELNNINPTSPGSTSEGCPDCIVPTASCFHYTDQLGDLITTLQLVDYVKAIGNKLCTTLQTIATIQVILANHETRLKNLETTTGILSGPQPEVQIPSGGLLGSGLFDVSTIAVTTEAELVALGSATGTPNSLFSAIQIIPSGIDLSPSLAQQNVNMGSLMGWITQANYNDLADSINNMWITLGDLRAGVSNIQDQLSVSGCEGLVVNMSASFDGAAVTLFFTGTVPAGFVDCSPSGNQVIITDCYGAQLITTVPVLTLVNNPTGWVINLGSTALSLTCSYNVKLYGCWINESINTTCERELTYAIVNTVDCISISSTPTENTIPFTFINTVSDPITYTIELYNASGVTLVASQSFINPATGAINSTFVTGITSNTTYKIRVKVTKDAVDTFCPFGTVATLQGSYWLYTGTFGDPSSGYFIQPDGSKWLLG